MTLPTPTPLPIDLDAEAIQLDGHWYSRDELARKIKSMLDSGEFAIGKPSQALEQLTQTLSTLRTIAFRVTPEMADAINAIGARYGRNVGSIIREALALHLGLPPPQEIERSAPRRTAPAGRRQTEPEIPIVVTPPAPAASPPSPAPVSPPLLTPPLPPELKAAQPAPQVIPGPGALKAAQTAGLVAPPPVSASSAPTVILDKAALGAVAESSPAEPAPAPAAPAGLTPKKTVEAGVERDWFGG